MPRARLLCAACSRLITYPRALFGIAGSSAHTRVNPHGYCYLFHTYDEAPGCTVAGDARSDYSWFEGFRWRFALCRGCGEHLGWRFERAGGRLFHALIDQRLSEDHSS